MSLATICLFTHIFPINKQELRGGFVRDVALELSRRGHEIHVVTPLRPGTLLEEQIDGMNVHRFKYWGWRKDRLLGQLRPTSILLFGSLVASGIWKCVVTILRYNVKVIHAYWVVPGGLISTICGCFTERPVVVTAAGSDLDFAVRHKLIRILAAFTLKHIDRLTPLSTHLKRAALSLGISEDKVTVIHHPLGIDSPSPPQSSYDFGLNKEFSKCLLYVGALAPPRRVDTVILAMQIVKRAYPDCHLLIVGGGILRASAEALVNQLGMQKCVHFLGGVPHTEVLKLMPNADLFVHCTNSEGLGIAIMEAMEAGLPVIASKVGGVPDLVCEGKTGFMLPADDVEGYADRIISLLKNDLLRKQFGANGRSFAEKYLNKDVILSQIEKVYQDVLNERKGI